MEGHIVRAVQFDGDDVGVVMHHEVAPDLVGGIGQATRVVSLADVSWSAAELTAPAASTNLAPRTAIGPFRLSVTRWWAL